MESFYEDSNEPFPSIRLEYSLTAERITDTEEHLCSLN
jgi:hypothetical protein